MGKARSEVVGSGKEALHEARDLYRRFVDSRGHKKPPPHELDPNAAVGAFLASVRGFVTAARSPYVIDKFAKCAPALLLAVVMRSLT